MSSAALTARDKQVLVLGGIAAFALVTVGMASIQAPPSAAGFPYAPHARLLLLPFGAMPFAAAVAIWSALNLFCLFRAGEMLGGRRDLALLACLSPAALMMVVSGHAGGFLALLATVVLVRGHGRPALAGLNLALMTAVQPQFALLFALLLLLAGYRRTVMLAVPWTLALAAASLITFGAEPWMDFVGAALAPPVLSPDGTVSLDAGARMAGLPEWAAHALHWGVSFAALAGAMVILRRDGAGPRSVALLLLAATLALPNAGSDLLTLAAPALTLALFLDDPADPRPFLPLAAAGLIWSLPILAALFGAGSWPVAPAALAAIILIALAREGPWKAVPAGRDVVGHRVEAER